MQKITTDQARAIRRKRADLMLSISELSNTINISRWTLSKIEHGDCFVKPSIYSKVMEWLVKDY